MLRCAFECCVARGFRFSLLVLFVQSSIVYLSTLSDRCSLNVTGELREALSDEEWWSGVGVAHLFGNVIDAMRKVENVCERAVVGEGADQPPRKPEPTRIVFRSERAPTHRNCTSDAPSLVATKKA